MSAAADVLTLILLIAVGFLIAVWFYESLSTRDVYLARPLAFVARRAPGSAVNVVAYVAIVGIGIPLFMVVWSTGLGVALWLVEATDRTESAGIIAIAVIGAARLLSYVRQKTAHELAKAIPLALMFALLTGGTLHLDEKLVLLAGDPEAQTIGSEALVVLLGLEFALRLATDGSHALLRAVRRRRGIESERGVWRTIWAALRPREAR